MSRSAAGRAATAVLLGLTALVARADDPCAGFAWDVTQERTLFGTDPQPLAASKDPATAPVLVATRLYQLSLGAQTTVTFATAPARARAIDGAYAGLARFTAETAGVYRISLDQPFWLDVVAGGESIGSRDFQGRPGCNAPHKIVEFALPAAVPLVLQFSGAASPALRVTITRAPGAHDPAT
jgi:hypothetical protein